MAQQVTSGHLNRLGDERNQHSYVGFYSSLIFFVFGGDYERESVPITTNKEDQGSFARMYCAKE